MKRPRLSRRDARAVLVGLAILVPTGAFRYLARPYLNRTSELQERIALERSLLARERALLREAAGFEDRVGELRRNYAAVRERLLAGRTHVEVEGALTAYVAKRAEQSGLLLQRSEGRDEPPPAAELLAATSVLVQTLGDLEGVLRFLHALESGPLLVRIDRIQVQPSPLRPADPGEAEPLQMGALITAYSLTSPLDASHAETDLPETQGGRP